MTKVKKNPTETIKDFVKGKEYWLDCAKKASGIYCGVNEYGNPCFRPVFNNDEYLEYPDGEVGFVRKDGFYLKQS